MVPYFTVGPCLACPSTHDQHVISFISSLILPKPSTRYWVDQELRPGLRPVVLGAVKLSLSQWVMAAFLCHPFAVHGLGRQVENTEGRGVDPCCSLSFQSPAGILVIHLGPTTNKAFCKNPGNTTFKKHRGTVLSKTKKQSKMLNGWSNVNSTHHRPTSFSWMRRSRSSFARSDYGLTVVNTKNVPDKTSIVVESVSSLASIFLPESTPAARSSPTFAWKRLRLWGKSPFVRVEDILLANLLQLPSCEFTNLPILDMLASCTFSIETSPDVHRKLFILVHLWGKKGTTGQKRQKTIYSKNSKNSQVGKWSKWSNMVSSTHTCMHATNIPSTPIIFVQNSASFAPPDFN